MFHFLYVLLHSISEIMFTNRKDLILEMKLDNQLWGCHRIADELKKI